MEKKRLFKLIKKAESISDLIRVMCYLLAMGLIVFTCFCQDQLSLTILSCCEGGAILVSGVILSDILPEAFLNCYAKKHGYSNYDDLYLKYLKDLEKQSKFEKKRHEACEQEVKPLSNEKCSCLGQNLDENLNFNPPKVKKKGGR